MNSAKARGASKAIPCEIEVIVFPDGREVPVVWQPEGRSFTEEESIGAEHFLALCRGERSS